MALASLFGNLEAEKLRIRVSVANGWQSASHRGIVDSMRNEELESAEKSAAEPGLVKVGKEGYIHGWICVRPPCGKVGDAVHHDEHGAGVITGHDGSGNMKARFSDGHEGTLGDEKSKLTQSASPPSAGWVPGSQSLLRQLGDSATREGKGFKDTHGSENSRYTTAGRELRNAAKALDAGDHEKAKDHLDSAITHLSKSKNTTPEGERTLETARKMRARLDGGAAPEAPKAPEVHAPATKTPEAVSAPTAGHGIPELKPSPAGVSLERDAELAEQKVNPATRLQISADPKGVAARLSDEELRSADVELARRATAMGKPGMVGRSHQAVKDEIAERAAKAAPPAALETPAAPAERKINVKGLPPGYTLHQIGEGTTDFNTKKTLHDYELRHNGEVAATLHNYGHSTPRDVRGNVAYGGFSHSVKTDFNLRGQAASNIRERVSDFRSRQSLVTGRDYGAVSAAAHDAAAAHQAAMLSSDEFSKYQGLRNSPPYLRHDAAMQRIANERAPEAKHPVEAPRASVNDVASLPAHQQVAYQMRVANGMPEDKALQYAQHVPAPKLRDTGPVNDAHLTPQERFARNVEAGIRGGVVSTGRGGPKGPPMRSRIGSVQDAQRAAIAHHAALGHMVGDPEGQRVNADNGEVRFGTANGLVGHMQKTPQGYQAVSARTGEVTGTHKKRVDALNELADIHNRDVAAARAAGTERTPPPRPEQVAGSEVINPWASGKSVQEMHHIAGNREALAGESTENLREYSSRLHGIASGPLFGTPRGNAAYHSKDLIDQELARRAAGGAPKA